jgi:hypothetical protein
MLRSYVGREFERLQDLDEARAREEMMRTADPGAGISTPSPASTPARSAAEEKENARKVLGVAEGASYDEIYKAFVRLNKRSDPANFPEGSPERSQALDVHKKVHQAFSLLTEGMDATEKRFRSLEI